MNESIDQQLHDLRAAADDPYQGPGPGPARARATERRRRRLGAVAVAAVLLVAAVFVGLRQEKPVRLQPATPSTTSAPAVPMVRSVSKDWRIDWPNSVMNLPANEDCPHHRVQFTNGKASFPPWQYSIGKPTYGDFTGDGRDDAVVVIECHGDAKVGGPESRWLVAAFTANERGGPKPLADLYSEQSYVTPVVSISGGVITLELRFAGADWRIEKYRWDGASMTRISIRETPHPPR